MSSSSLPQPQGWSEPAEIEALAMLARRLEHQVSDADHGPRQVLAAGPWAPSAGLPGLGAFAEAEELGRRYLDALDGFADGLRTLEGLLAGLAEDCARLAGASAAPSLARRDSLPIPRTGDLRPVRHREGQEPVPHRERQGVGSGRAGLGEEAA